jgi:hypothetical protein
MILGTLKIGCAPLLIHFCEVRFGRMKPGFDRLGVSQDIHCMDIQYRQVIEGARFFGSELAFLAKDDAEQTGDELFESWPRSTRGLEYFPELHLVDRWAGFRGTGRTRHRDSLWQFPRLRRDCVRERTNIRQSPLWIRQKARP